MKDIREALNVFNIDKILKQREAEILRLRFGIDKTHPHILEEVGNIFNLTKERIRQIECKAIRKLRFL